jgi:hypothetical protein
MYPSEIVMPMKAEMTEGGFEELLTPESVDSALTQKGTSLVFINSVCGCAAGSARPGVLTAPNVQIICLPALQVLIRMPLKRSVNICCLIHQVHPLLHYLKTVNWFILLNVIILKAALHK